MAETEFEQELTSLLKRHGADVAAETPDFILARFLLEAFAAFKAATTKRDRWLWDTSAPL